jgi:hypothetical protein
LRKPTLFLKGTNVAIMIFKKPKYYEWWVLNCSFIWDHVEAENDNTPKVYSNFGHCCCEHGNSSDWEVGDPNC